MSGPGAEPDTEPDVGRRDRGSATVFALTLTFVFMAGAFVWLTTVADQRIHDRTQAAAVAFQAARAGAQQLDQDAARRGVVVIDHGKAVAAARAAVARLVGGSGDSGSLGSLRINGNRVTATVTISTGGAAMTRTATATAQIGFDGG